MKFLWWPTQTNTPLIFISYTGIVCNAAKVFIRLYTYICVCTISQVDNVLYVECLELMIRIYQIPNVARVTEMGRDL